MANWHALGMVEYYKFCDFFIGFSFPLHMVVKFNILLPTFFADIGLIG